MIRIICLLLSALAFTPIALAKPLAPEQVPEPLKPWVDWVLQDNPERTCPFIYNSYEQKRCSWPTQLLLDLKNTTGTFAISWQVYQDSWISLPGDSKYWPQNVSVNSKAALVMDKDGKPAIKLAAGFYQIKGDFFWDSMPENLSIPNDTGLVAVTVNGVDIASPAIKDGQLWLKQSETGQNKADHAENNLTLQVFRKLIDDVPLQLVTRLELDVSGEQREVKLALPILTGFIPLQLQSPLPARLEPDGQLLLQARPGHWQIDIMARATAELNSVALNGPKDSSNSTWPESEIWVFEARPELRIVEIGQLTAIDTSQTNLPDDWKALPAYAIAPGQAMALTVVRRGDAEPEPNQLSLTRKLWLDFAGTGYTINDTISGKMTSAWRLNALPQTQLGKVILDGNNQLITQDMNNKQGVEVRKGLLNLDADSRNEGNIHSLSAVGWEQSFHSVNAELNLPPGWRLLAATGVDNVPDSWLSRWTLLDLFEVLIAALAIGRLWSVSWGVFALITLMLIWHEPEAPRFVWLNILAAIALLKVVPDGRFHKLLVGYRAFFWLALVFIAVPFMVQQIRTGLYPQLEYPWQAIIPQSGGYAADAVQNLAAPASAPMPSAEPPMEADVAVSEEMAVRKAMPARPDFASKAESSSNFSSQDFERVDPKAKVQTGPGLPQWQWHTVSLSWNGSITADQQVHLWYLSPTLTLLLNFIRVGLVAVLALLMFGVAEKFRYKLKTSLPLWLWLVLLPSLASPPQNAYAEFPDPALLDTLKAKLLEAPDCLPACAQIPQMHIAISDKALTISLQAHAQQALALPLPAAYEQWFPNQVLVDGTAAHGLYRENNGLWLNLAPGEHRVVMTGATPSLNKFTLPLPLIPHRLTLDSNTWQVLGLHENAQPDGQLQFNRVQQAQQESGQNQSYSAQLPAFVRIERSLQLGLDWRVLTRITRISPADSAVVLAVPLLAGESVTTPGIRVKEGKVEVNMAAQSMELAWESTLEKSAQIDLQASQTEHWVEVWRADVSPLWHLEATGIAMMYQNTEAQWLPEWHPWPGEKVSLQLTRPKAIEGQTLTIDTSHLSVKPGQRSQDVDLSFSIRSSQGTQHTLTLPEQAVLQTVSIDGENRAIRPENRKLTLPINPGQHQIAISWQQAPGISAIFASPSVDLGLASVNSNISVVLGEDRWVLLTLGPRFGPAVLFWGMLVVIALLAFGLAKIPLTPIKHWQWFLLLIGLSQIPLAAAGVVIAWFMLLAWRSANVNETSRFFNGLQLLLGGLTVLSLSLLFYAVAQGLLSSPDMQIIGNQSSAFNLNWYQDRSASVLPTATVVSVPLMAYRLLMLAWSLWLAMSLLNWLKWGWGCFSANGLWHKKEPVKKAEKVEDDPDASAS